ncbi:MAG: glycosyltransferase [Rikenellaceae bacterium]
MDISVIVPIYGVEIYVERCLRSLFTQTKSAGVEFVLIDDCTMDRSMEIAYRVIADYPELHVRVISNEVNCGIAATRQKGIDAAMGRYTIQIDSDDWCEPMMLERLYAKATQDNADIVVCDYVVESDEHPSYVRLVEFDAADPFHEYINGAINSQLWNKLVLTELLRCDDFKKYSVEFNFGEDAAMSLMLLFNARIVSKVSGAFYHYLERENSLSRIYTTQQCGDFIEMISFYEKYVGDKGLLDKYREEIETKEIEVKFLILKNSDRQTQKRFYRAFDNLTSRIWQRCKLGAHNKLALYLASVGYLKCANFIWYTTKFMKFIMRE